MLAHLAVQPGMVRLRTDQEIALLVVLLVAVDVVYHLVRLQRTSESFLCDLTVKVSAVSFGIAFLFATSDVRLTGKVRSMRLMLWCQDGMTYLARSRAVLTGRLERLETRTTSGTRDRIAKRLAVLASTSVVAESLRNTCAGRESCTAPDAVQSLPSVRDSIKSMTAATGSSSGSSIAVRSTSEGSILAL